MKRLLFIFIIVIISVFIFIYGRSGQSKGDASFAASDASRSDIKSGTPKDTPLPTGGPRPAMVLQTGHATAVRGEGVLFVYGTTAFSPNGRYVVTAAATDGSGEAILWEIATGRQVRTFTGPEDPVTGFAFSPDGRRLLAGSWNEAVIWDVDSGQIYKRLPHPPEMTGGTVPLAFSGDGRYCVTTPEKLAVVWDAETGGHVRTLGPFDQTVGAMAFHPKRSDQLLIAIGPFDEPGEVNLWDVTTGEKLRSFGPIDGPVTIATFTHDAGEVMTFNAKQGPKQVTFWNAETGAKLSSREVPASTRRVVLIDGDNSLLLNHYQGTPGSTELQVTTGSLLRNIYQRFDMVSPDGKYALDLGGSSAVVWDVATGKEIQTLRSGRAIPESVAFSPDGRRLIASSTIWAGGKEFSYAAQWDTDAGRLLRLFRAPAYETSISEIYGPFTRVAFSPDGKRIMARQNAWVARIWDADSGEVVGTLRNDLFMDPAGFDSSGRNVLARSGTGFGLYDANTGEQTQSYTGYWRDRPERSKPGDTMFVSGIGGKVAMAGAGYETGWGGKEYVPENIRCFVEWSIWEADTGKELNHYQGPVPDPVTCLAVSPDGLRVAVGMNRGHHRDQTLPVSERGTVALYEAGFGMQIWSKNIAGRGITTLAFNRDGTRLVAVGKQKSTATVFEMSTGEVVCQLQGHTLGINDAVFSPDGERIATCADDGTIRLWNAASGRELASMMTFDDGREWLTVTPQGFYDGSVEGRQLVCWRIEGEVFPVELYEKHFYRPDQLALVVQGKNPGTDESVPGSHQPPRVRLQPEKIDAESVSFRAEAIPGSKGTMIRSLRVLVDGRDIAPETAGKIAREQADPSKVVFRGQIDFPSGKRKAVVAAIATDEYGLRSEPAMATIVLPGPASAVNRTLYVLAVGVSKYKFSGNNLRYAHADALALTNEIKRQEGMAFQKVETRVLVDAEATVANIRSGLDWLGRACGPADVAIVLFSGHGMRSRSGRLYYVPHEADDDAVATTFLPWETVDDGLRQVRASLVLFLSDCCHAGAFGERMPSQDELAYPLVSNAGVMVFAASRGREWSLEKSELGLGAFTFAVVEGMSGKADLIADKRITISELQTYVANRVKQLTGDQQHPHIPRINNFDPEVVIGHVE